ncbi:hypothetical protein [Agromyces sp. NPDC058104]|uniref:hypothetical protein n=1 Tax=Agromyces sp. NPDC058104 TaxID=3346342 RepID=UPI0036DDAE18
MSSSAARAAGRSRIDAVRRALLALLALLGVAAVLVGLLAMHTAGAGAEHTATVAVSHGAQAHAATEPGGGDHAASPAAVSAAEHHVLAGFGTTALVASVIGSAGDAVACDEACMSALSDCALMVMSCAMLLVLVAFVLLAGGPAVFRRLHDRGTALLAGLLRAIPSHLHRPDLTVLSISRT